MAPSIAAEAARGTKRKRPGSPPNQSHSASSQKLSGKNGRNPHPPAHPSSKLSSNGTQTSTKPSNGHLAISSPSSLSTTRATASPSNRRTTLLQSRQSLPIYPHSSSILSALRKTDILLLSGETGSGKSTQLPQFLLEAPWCTGRIAVTQPRRMAAISLARRVAEELGSPLGKASPASRVGYSVRFDDNVGKAKKGIKYLTEGMLLQEMLRNPGLEEYSVVVVDEVHERSVNVDLMLGFLRDLVTGRGQGVKRKGARLKVVVMSATADTEGLKRFFEEGFQELGSVSKLDNGAEKKGTSTGANTNGQSPDHVSMESVKGRQYPVETVYLPEPIQDFAEAALKCIFQVHCKEPMPGDILVFLTGQDTVQSLQKNVEEYAQGLTVDYPKLLVLPLFAALPQAAQQRIFDPAPPRTRKVILATNIAETSITVPGVRFVIDSGKAKLKQYRQRLGLDSLLVKPISQSSAVQRKGRAGREAAGKCWRLYTERDYNKLEAENAPEILRTDLASAVLTMKASGVEDVLSFPLLTPPPREAMERALLGLLQLGALNEADGAISEVGRKISRLPLTPALGRVIIAAADPSMDCLLPVIDIVACFSVENLFLNTDTEEMREEATKARALLYRRLGDHLTLLAAVQGYAAEMADRKQWAKKHLISHRAMQSVMDVRKQLRAQCQQSHLLPRRLPTSTSTPGATTTDASSEDAAATISEETQHNILKAFLRGFATNVARLMPDGGYRTVTGNQTVAIHPSSVLFGRKCEAILYNEFVYTNRTYARGVSAVQLDWLEEVYL